MPFLSNAHTHSTWCDGKCSISQMLQAALDAGFVSLGFSSHAAQGFDYAYSMSEPNQRGYFDELRALQKHAPIRIWAGLELDAFAGGEELQMARAADYLLGSTHYLHAERGGDGVAVDGDPVKLRQYIDRAFAGDGLATTKRFYEITADFLCREKPDIIGHFDLIRKHAKTIGLFDENDPAYRKIALDALERAFPSKAVLEVNTGGMARGYLSTPYPTLELLCAWREMGGRVTITSDCHDARCLTHAFDTAEALIRQAGFKSICRLGTGDTLWEETDL